METRIRIPRRWVIIASSIALILTIAISLSTTLEIRAPSYKMIPIRLTQATKFEQSDRDANANPKGTLNGSAFDRASIVGATATPSLGFFATIPISGTATPAPTPIDEGVIGNELPSESISTSIDEGYIGPLQTLIPAPYQAPAANGPLPILALSYTGSGGPKHCRGSLIQKLNVPPPASDWTNGTCVDLSSEANCGVFIANKDDHCEAQLFNMAGCYNTTRTYVNTVVFMPEERPVGARWSSMFVRCGIVVSEAGLIDPNILGELLVKPGGKPGEG
ncbi:hypothetical protein P154DRAFT_546808 [Amniculicola lignicola CBS 123094]|uniref:Uncharacterized protein n=1 Tax=Amniculicola lignicola CBS 123094 TaxID=1392246 RepID=A0A6A5WEF4_9PLEO|nr:hypothetical protein P154DRAFT_546808 [Amniculicola lignicola CBS 123094]